MPKLNIADPESSYYDTLARRSEGLAYYDGEGWRRPA